MVLDRRKKGRMTKLFGQKIYLETVPRAVYLVNLPYAAAESECTMRVLLKTRQAASEKNAASE